MGTLKSNNIILNVKVVYIYIYEFYVASDGVVRSFCHPIFQNVSLARRTFPNTAASESLGFAPTFLRISALMSQRRNGLVRFSTPKRLGTVGCPRCRNLFISSTLAIRSVFPGSMLAANFALDAVYS